jgi:hypothetical protein
MTNEPLNFSFFPSLHSRAFLFESSMELGMEKRDSGEIIKDQFLLLKSALSSAG